MLYKVCYKSYHFLELKPVALADASIPMGPQGWALLPCLHPCPCLGTALSHSLAECTSDLLILMTWHQSSHGITFSSRLHFWT